MTVCRDSHGGTTQCSKACLCKPSLGSLLVHTAPRALPSSDTQWPLAAQVRVSLGEGASGSTPLPRCVGVSAPRTRTVLLQHRRSGSAGCGHQRASGRRSHVKKRACLTWRRGGQFKGQGRNLQMHAVVNKDEGDLPPS